MPEDAELQKLEELADRLTPERIAALLYWNPGRTKKVLDLIASRLPNFPHPNDRKAGGADGVVDTHGAQNDNGRRMELEVPVVARKASQNPTALPKNRKSLMQEAVILGYTDRAGRSRAVTNDMIEAILKQAGFVDVARASLVTKLNRMKSLNTLTWNKDSRGGDVHITDEGRKHFKRLRDRLLTSEEMDLLEERVPELFTDGGSR